MTQPTVREQLLVRLERAGALVDQSAADALEQYFSLLTRWNAKVNLTALPLDPFADDTLDRLFVEPIAAAQHLHPPHFRDVPLKWLDLGTGGGSPAIPLKIVRPSWALTMVEAKERKAAFLREAIRVLNLRDAAVQKVRFEQLSATADLVTVRAVKLNSDFASAARQLLKQDGLLAVFSSSEVSLTGFVRETVVSLIPEGSAVLTLLRVPRGTKCR